jgi:Mg-chelatase subunit ChlD
MSNETPFTAHGDEPVEARIVSWVLGEASAFEVAELERLCEERPELMVFKRRMAALHGLITDAEKPRFNHAWKLPAGKRRPLDEIIGEEPPVRVDFEKEKRIRHSGRRAFLAIAACLILTVVVAGLMAPMVLKQSRKADVSEARSKAMQRELAAMEEQEMSEGMEALRTDLPQELIEGTPKPIVLPGQTPPREKAQRDAPAARFHMDAPAMMAKRAQPESALKPSAPSSSMARVITASETSAVAVPTPDVDVTAPSLDFGAGSDFGDGRGKGSGSGGGFANAPSKNERSNDGPSVPGSASVLADAKEGELKKDLATPDEVRKDLYQAEGNYNLGKYDDAKREYEDVLRKDPSNAAARKGMEQIASGKSDYYRAAYDHTRAELLAQVDNAWELNVPAESGAKDKEVTAPADKVEMTKSVNFKKIIAKPEPPKVDLTQLMEEIAASEDPYSTFSLNISDASFQIAQAALAKGERPDPAGIKVEQFYNAVNYGDPAPAAGQPVSCVIEQAAHPVIPGRKLVRVALKTAAAGRSAAQPLRLTLLVDQSGSMVRADRREAMDTAMRSLGTLLTDKDLVTVIGFSRTSRLLAVDMKGNEVGEKLAGLVNQAASEGGTNLEEAIKLAEEKAMRQKLVGAQNRIVLFTDGAANLGDADPQRLAAKVEQLRQQGIAFDIAGIAADDLNDELLAELARKGNGRYSVVGKGENQNFAKQLAGSFRPAAENVKVQVRFNPERVARYKLIGFEKDRLKTEDFRNDAVDAAELAAEEVGVAIYQVEPLAEGRGEIGEVSVRFRDTASGEMVERMWTMTHNSATTGVDRATPSMQLAVLSMLAGEKLKGGPLADAIDFNNFSQAQATVKQAFGQDTRVSEMLRMVNALK